MQHVPISLVFAYGRDGQDVPILPRNLLVSSSTLSLFHAALGIRLWGGIVNSLAFIPTLGYARARGFCCFS
ncbi:MAG: hypothetical protein HC773_02875 [Scytonema sp. CRU_2_7]|nr:hypothetical protein [Scytonema sp. CRU_2_7]